MAQAQLKGMIKVGNHKLTGGKRISFMRDRWA